MGEIMPSQHISLGMIPPTPSQRPTPPPDPTIENVLYGLDMFWSKLDATKGQVNLATSLLHLPNFDIGDEYEEGTMRALGKKGWRRHSVGGTIWGGSM